MSLHLDGNVRKTIPLWSIGRSVQISVSNKKAHENGRK
jgi:hypothetical protein